jgi:hypothetical protein
MKTVQLAIPDSKYVQTLKNLLLRDGAHNVRLVERPDLAVDGVVVIDANNPENLSLLETNPDRFVVIARKGTDNLSTIWNAGATHVVFEKDSPTTSQLSIIAAELRLAS